MKKLARAIVKMRRLILIAAVLLLIPAAVGAIATPINYDILSYLPQELDSRVGQLLLETDYHLASTNMITVEGMPTNELLAMKAEIDEVPDVLNTFWLSDVLDPAVPTEMLPADVQQFMFGKNDSTILIVQLGGSSVSEETMQAVAQIKKILRKNCFFGGISVILSDTKALVMGEMPWYVLCAVGGCLLVLFLSLESWLTPFLFMLGLLFPLVYNFGTNIFLGQVCFITVSLAAVLQLGVTMDFSIFLLHRYDEEKELCASNEEAMENAICKTMSSITASSLTTIAGLVAMTFMKFGLGRDLGIVLIKAILISMLTVFLLMPGLLLKLGPAMDKTKHRNFVPKISGVGRLAWRTRRVVPLVFAAVLVVACIGANRVSYVYSEAPLKTHNADVNRTASQAITDDFGDETVLAVVVPAGDYTQEAALLDALSAVPEVKSAVGIAGLEAAGGYRLADAVDYRTFAQLSGADSTSAQALFALYAAENGAAQTAAQDLSGYQVPLLKLFEFLNDKIADGTVTLSAAQAAQVTALSSQLERASAQLEARRTTGLCSRSPRPRTGTRRLPCSTASTPSCTSTTPPTAISSATPCPPTGPSKRSRRTTSWSAPCPSSWSCSCCCSRSARSVCPFCSRSSFRAASGSTSASRCSRASMCSSWSISWPAPFRWAATWTMRSSSPRTIPRRAPIRARARP